MDRSGQKWSEVDRSGQKWTEVDRSGQKEVDRGGQKWTEMKISGYIFQHGYLRRRRLKQVLLRAEDLCERGGQLRSPVEKYVSWVRIRRKKVEYEGRLKRIVE